MDDDRNFELQYHGVHANQSFDNHYSSLVTRMALATPQYRDERQKQGPLRAEPGPLQPLRIPEQPTTHSITEP